MIKNVLLILMSLMIAFSFTTTYAYDPFSAEQDKKETDEDEEPKEPVYPPYHGPKKRIAVTRFDNKVKGAYGNWNLGDGMSEMLITELIKTNRFVVVERQALQDILGEQELGQTGVVKKETGEYKNR